MANSDYNDFYQAVLNEEENLRFKRKPALLTDTTQNTGNFDFNKPKKKEDKGGNIFSVPYKDRKKREIFDKKIRGYLKKAANEGPVKTNWNIDASTEYQYGQPLTPDDYGYGLKTGKLTTIGNKVYRKYKGDDGKVHRELEPTHVITNSGEIKPIIYPSGIGNDSYNNDSFTKLARQTTPEKLKDAGFWEGLKNKLYYSTPISDVTQGLKNIFYGDNKYYGQAPMSNLEGSPTYELGTNIGGVVEGGAQLGALGAAGVGPALGMGLLTGANEFGDYAKNLQTLPAALANTGISAAEGAMFGRLPETKTLKDVAKNYGRTLIPVGAGELGRQGIVAAQGGNFNLLDVAQNTFVNAGILSAFNLIGMGGRKIRDIDVYNKQPIVKKIQATKAWNEVGKEIVENPGATPEDVLNKLEEQKLVKKAPKGWQRKRMLKGVEDVMGMHKAELAQQPPATAPSDATNVNQNIQPPAETGPKDFADIVKEAKQNAEPINPNDLLNKVPTENTVENQGIIEPPPAQGQGIELPPQPEAGQEIGINAQDVQPPAPEVTPPSLPEYNQQVAQMVNHPATKHVVDNVNQQMSKLYPVENGKVYQHADYPKILAATYNDVKVSLEHNPSAQEMYLNLNTLSTSDNNMVPDYFADANQIGKYHNPAEQSLPSSKGIEAIGIYKLFRSKLQQKYTSNGVSSPEAAIYATQEIANKIGFKGETGKVPEAFVKKVDKMSYPEMKQMMGLEQPPVAPPPEPQPPQEPSIPEELKKKSDNGLPEGTVKAGLNPLEPIVDKYKEYKANKKLGSDQTTLTNIEKSPTIQKLKAELATQGLSDAEINNKVQAEVSRLYDENQELNKGKLDMFTPADMTGSKEVVSIKKAGLPGESLGEKYVNEINAKLLFARKGIKAEEEGLIYKTNSSIHKGITKLRLAKNEGRITQEQFDAAKEALTSPQNILNTMKDELHRANTNAEKPYNISPERIQFLAGKKYPEFRTIFDKISDHEIEGKLAHGLHTPSSEIGKLYAQQKEAKTDYDAKLEEVNNLRKEYVKAKGGKVSKDKLNVMAKDINRLQKKLEKHEYQSIKNKIQWIEKGLNQIEEGKDSHYISGWSANKGNYAASIEAVEPNSEGGYRRISPGDTDNKFFMKFKKAAERDKSLNDFYKKMHVTTIDGVPIDQATRIPDGVAIMDKVNYNGEPVDVNGKPVRLSGLPADREMVKIIPNIDISHHINLSRDQWQAQVNKLINETGIQTEQKATTIFKKITNKNIDELGKQLDKFNKLKEEIEKSSDPNDEQVGMLLDELGYMGDVISTAMDLQTGITGRQADALANNAAHTIEQIQSWSQQPPPAGFKTSKGHIGTHDFKDLKDYAKYFNEVIDKINGTTVSNLTKGHEKWQIDNITRDLQEKGLTNNKTYKYIQRYAEDLDKTYQPGPLMKKAAIVTSAVAQIESAMALTMNFSSQVFNHLMGVNTTGSLGIEEKFRAKGYKGSLKSTLGKMAERIENDILLRDPKKFLKKYKSTEEYLDARQKRINPYKKTSDPNSKQSLMFDTFKNLEDTGTFGSSVVRNLIEGDFGLLSKSSFINKAYILQRITEYANRVFSSTAAMENYMKKNPFEKSGKTREQYINDATTEAQMYTARTQGKFELSWRSEIERKFAGHPLVRQLLVLQSPAIRQLYLYRHFFEKAFKLSPDKKRQVAPLIAMMLGTTLVGGINSIPGVNTVYRIAEAIMDDLNTKNPTKTIVKENLNEKMKHYLRDVYKVFGMSEKVATKTADDTFNILYYGLLSWGTNTNFQYEGGIMGLIEPLIFTMTKKLANNLDKEKNPESFGGAQFSRIVHGIKELQAGMHLSNQGEPLGGKYDMKDFMMTLLFRQPYQDAEANRAYYEDQSPMSTRVQRENVITKIIKTPGIKIQGTKLSKTGFAKAYAKQLADYAPTIRDGIVDIYSSKNNDIQPSVKKYNDLLMNNSLTYKGKTLPITEWISRGLGQDPNVRMYGRNDKYSRKVKQLVNNVYDYYSVDAIADGFNNYAQKKLGAKGLKFINQFNNIKMNGKYIGDYPYNDRGYIYAVYKLQEFIKKNVKQ